MNKLLNALGLISKKELAKHLENCAYNSDTYKTSKDERIYYSDMGAWSIINSIRFKFNIKWSDERFYEEKTSADKPKAPEPKYDINDIVHVKEVSYGNSVHENVVGIIKDRFNHKLSGDVYYHVTFNKGTPQKVWESEIISRIPAKLVVSRFKNELASRLFEHLISRVNFSYMSIDDFFEWEEHQDINIVPSNNKFNVGDRVIFKDVIDNGERHGTIKRVNFDELHGMFRYSIVDASTPARCYVRFEDSLLRDYRNYDEKDLGHGGFTKMYIANDIRNTKAAIERLRANSTYGLSAYPKFDYKKIIFSGPCTIILWKDGTKTMARVSKTDAFDPEKGVAICFMKRAIGEIDGKKVLRKASKDFYDEITKEVEKDLDIFTPPKFNFEEAVKNTLDSIKYCLDTDVRIKASADNNTSEVFFDDTKEEVKNNDN